MKDLATRHKIEIPHGISRPFNRLELHIQSAWVQLLANREEQRRSRQYFFVFLQCPQYGIRENRLITGLVGNRIVLPRTDQEPRPILMANGQIAIAGKEVR